jgi:hypothetical protein
MDFGAFWALEPNCFRSRGHLAPLPSEGIFFLNVSKEKLKQAPGYDKNSLPDMGDTHWGTKIADFYEAPRGERYYGYDYGLMFYPQIAQEDPFQKTLVRYRPGQKLTPHQIRLYGLTTRIYWSLPKT